MKFISWCQRPYSIRTRIKTDFDSGTHVVGLRQRPYSIRTRIKTIFPESHASRTSRQRPYSIRTRIKTIFRCRYQRLLQVRDHIPLEQGLRRGYNRRRVGGLWGQRPYSIRTRIKTCGSIRWRYFRWCQRPYSIRTRIKTDGYGIVSHLIHVRDHIPLEQGLRHIMTGLPNLSTKSETIFH